MIHSKKTECVTWTRTTLTGRDILRMCAASKRVKITKDTEVLFQVPTGADYSGVTLNMLDDKELVIIVTSKSYDKRTKK